MKKTVLLAAAIFAFALFGVHAQVAYTTYSDWTSWNGTVSNSPSEYLIFQPTNAFDYDGVTANGIGNNNPGGTSVGGSLEVSPIVPCNWGVFGPAFGFGGPSGSLIAAMDGPGAGFGSPMVAQSGTLLVDYTMPDHALGGTFFSMGIFFQDNVQWGGWSASQNNDLGPVTTPVGTEEMYQAVIPYTLNTNSSLAWGQIGLWLFTDYQGTNSWYIDNISVVPLPNAVIPAPITSLFTTSNDFALFTSSGGDVIQATNDWDADMSITNGLGNTNAPSAIGTAGSLILYWSSLESGYGSIAAGPDEEQNTAFMQAIDPGCNTGTETSVAAYGNIYMDYSQPDNSGGGNYFQMGIGFAYAADGYYGAPFWPSSTKDLGVTDSSGYEVYQATIPYTINAGNYYGFTPYIDVNSNYQPTNGFHIDAITVSSAQAPLITGVSLNGTSLVIQGTNGLSGDKFTVLTTTNLASPWSVMSGGNPFSSPSFTITNTINPASTPSFYRIKVP